MTVIHKTKIFDSVDGFPPFIDVGELTDATVTKRGDQWWIFLAGEVNGHEGIQLFSASLPPGTTLAATGWRLTPHPRDPKRVGPLATHERSKAWDLKGGRHCPSYVKGKDAPDRQLGRANLLCRRSGKSLGSLRHRLSRMGRQQMG